MVSVPVVSFIFIQSQNNLFVELFLTYQEQNLLLNEKTFFIIPLLPEWLLLGSPKLMDPHPNQQHAGLQHSILSKKNYLLHPAPYSFTNLAIHTIEY